MSEKTWKMMFDNPFADIPNEEINIAIAEACGWKVACSNSDGNCWWAEDDSGLVIRGGVSERHAKRVCYPQFATDLNAMSRAEKYLGDDLDRLEKYHYNLCRAAWRGKAYIPDIEDMLPLGCMALNWMISATARQRAEAFLKTVEVKAIKELHKE